MNHPNPTDMAQMAISRKEVERERNLWVEKTQNNETPEIQLV